MARAYVLIIAETGRTGAVAEAIKEIEGVSAVDIVSGAYDLVAVLDCKDAQAIGRLVMTQLHGTRGLKTTHTLMAIEDIRR